MLRGVNRSIWYLLALSFTVTPLACSGDDDGTDDVKDGRCTTDDDCPADQFCNDGMVCAAGTGDECAMDSDCGPGMACDTMVTGCGLMRGCRNACIPRACDGAGQCDSLVCVDGACAESPMCDAGVCPDGLVCDGDSRLCVEPVAEACTVDTDCMTAGDICVGGFCQAPQDCTFSSDCPTDQRCVQEVCRDPCTMDEQCGNPMAFQCDTLTGECNQRCFDDLVCPSGFICEGPAMNQLCVPAECAMDSDCTGNNERCEGADMGHGRCIEVQMCDVNVPDDCQPNFECIAGECVELDTCRGDRDCQASRYCDDRHCQPAEACNNGMCPAGFDCIGARCVPEVCRGEGDCATGEVCVRGACVPPNDGSAVATVEIITTAGSVTAGTTYRFRAVAYDANDEVVPGVTVAWMSSMTDVATIDAAGIATGGQTLGTTEIVASVDTGAMTVSSQPVALENLDARAILVVSETTGAPVEAATVVCGTDTQVTGANGVVTFVGTSSVTCSVYASNHDYVTVLGLDGSATIRLPTITRTDRSTGMTGPIDLSMVQGEGNVEIAFSGASFAAPLSELTPSMLFGSNVFAFAIPTGGGIEVPAAATAIATIGIPITVKGEYHSETRAGRRTAWSFGGLVGLADLGLTGGGDIVTNLLPVLQAFTHGTTGNYTTLTPVPEVVDTDDVDGDGDTMEVVPDYSGFAQVSVTPDTLQRLRVQVSGDAAMAPADATAIILVSGVIVPRVGFVPLGMDGLAAAGNVGSFSTAMAPAHRGLEVGAYAVLATAANIGGGNLAPTMSAQMFVGESLPTEVSLDRGWLGTPGGSYDDGTRVLGATAAGDAWRVRFSSTTGSWVVVGPSSVSSFTLPTPPGGMDDHAASSSIFLEDLDLGGRESTALFGVGLDDIAANGLIERFSQQVVR